METAGLVNLYKCQNPECGAEHWTLNAATGVTPFLMRCRTCGQMAESKMYRIDTQRYIATGLLIGYEWYHPDEAEIADLEQQGFGIREHVENGGLSLRTVDPPLRLFPQMLSSDQITVANAAIALFTTDAATVATGAGVSVDVAETLLMYLRNTLGVYLFQNMSNPDPTPRTRVEADGYPKPLASAPETTTD